MKSLTQRLKRLKDDERGVSPVVGFVLIFALIMIVFTLYQSSVVPAQNKEVEFKHSQIVEGQMSELNDALKQAGASGVPQSVTIDTGFQYPDRALAINPGSPVGTLETVDAPNVTLSGLSDGSGYWSANPEFETRLVSYRPTYNLFQQETTDTLENGMFVKNFENGNAFLKSNGSVVSKNGKRIDLVLVGGEYQRSQMTTSATVQPVSTSTEYRSLTATGSNSSITIPTTLPESDPDSRTWDDIVSDNSQIDGMSYSTQSNGPNAVTLELKAGQQYSIRLSKVTFGSPDSPGLKYLESEDDRLNRTAAVGIPETFTVTARDEFGNPVSGATVNATSNGSGVFTRSNGSSVENVATSDDGRLIYTYTPADADAGNTTTVDFTLDGGSGTAGLDTVSYNLTIPPEENDTNEGSLGVGDIRNGYEVGVIIESVTTDTSGSSADRINIEFKNIGSENMTAKQVRLNGFLSQGANSEFIRNASFDGTNVSFNGNITQLDHDFTIHTNQTETIELIPNGDFKQGGFLILDVRFRGEDGQIHTGTYAITVPG